MADKIIGMNYTNLNCGLLTYLFKEMGIPDFLKKKKKIV